MAFPHLEKAPIVEGLIDLRVRLANGFEAEKLKELHGRIADRYPTCLESSTFQTHLEFNAQRGAKHAFLRNVSGYRFESADTRYVFQAQVGGFTLSRLRPYETWELLFAEAKELWAHYIEVARPESVTRVATRYINRLELPVPLRDFDDYLTAAPKVPLGLPQSVSEFFARVVAPEPQCGASVILTQILEPADTARGVLPVILDIDVFKEEVFTPKSEAPWNLLSKFRDLKNEAFFGSVTDKAKELFR
ncbi:MAG: TIGR04255 family protein [Burkholderiales bacterium]